MQMLMGENKMNQKIKTYLTNLESEHNIKILLACETGSRAWGFPSPDSDYDVRIIYVHHYDWYLSLNEAKDNLNLMLDDNLIDISGWDFRKSLRLLAKSNAPLIERIQSPIVYQQECDFVAQITKLAQACYSRISSVHHYLSMAKKACADLQQAQQADGAYKLKRLFYALRAACVCRWILRYERMPYIELAPACQQTDVPPSVVARIDELIALKSTVDEGYRHSGDDALLAFIRDTIAETEEKRLSLPDRRADWSALDAFFRVMVKQHG